MAEEEEFKIDVRLRNGDWIASDHITGAYGIGKTVPHALMDYQEDLQHWQLKIATWDGELAPRLKTAKAKAGGWFRWRE